MSQGWDCSRHHPKEALPTFSSHPSKLKQLARVVFRISMASLRLELRRSVAVDARLGVLSQACWVGAMARRGRLILCRLC